MHFAKMQHHTLCGDSREHNSGYTVALKPALFPAQHVKEPRRSSDANPGHRAVPSLDKVLSYCAILSWLNLLHHGHWAAHNRASVMARTWRKFVLLLHEFTLQLPDLIRLIISNLHVLSIWMSNSGSSPEVFLAECWCTDDGGSRMQPTLHLPVVCSWHHLQSFTTDVADRWRNTE